MLTFTKTVKQNKCTNLHKAVQTLAVTAGDSEIAVKANLPVFTVMRDGCPGAPAVLGECLRPMGRFDGTII